MKKGTKVLLKKKELDRMVERMCYEIVELHEPFLQTCIVGIQQKGVQLAERILKKLKQIYPKVEIPFGKLDITFFRDDFRLGNKIIAPHEMEMDFLIEGKKVILIDDVLYTGRTTQAALQALMQFGRPAQVELLVLVDRRFNRLFPIQADYIGMKVDALDEAYVKVDLDDDQEDDKVLFYDAERKSI